MVFSLPPLAVVTFTFPVNTSAKKEKKIDMCAELEGYILEWYVSLAEPVVVGVQEITIKEEKKPLSAVKPLERISYCVSYFFIIISWGWSKSAQSFYSLRC